MDHPVRSAHIISNIRIAEQDDASGDCVLTSNYHVLMHWKDQRMFGGRYTHHLKRTDDGLAIRHKRVDLINCDAPQTSILVYL